MDAETAAVIRDLRGALAGWVDMRESDDAALAAADALLGGPVAPHASGAQIATARRLYCQSTENNVEVPDDALLSDCGDGAYWVQAWVYVDADESGPSCSECYAELDELGVWEGRELICRTCAELITEAGNGDLAVER